MIPGRLIKGGHLIEFQLSFETARYEKLINNISYFLYVNISYLLYTNATIKIIKSRRTNPPRTPIIIHTVSSLLLVGPTGISVGVDVGLKRDSTPVILAPIAASICRS